MLRPDPNYEVAFPLVKTVLPPHAATVIGKLRLHKQGDEGHVFTFTDAGSRSYAKCKVKT